MQRRKFARSRGGREESVAAFTRVRPWWRNWKAASIEWGFDGLSVDFASENRESRIDVRRSAWPVSVYVTYKVSQNGIYTCML